MPKFSPISFIKTNKVVSALIAIALLTIILVPSIYFGLKQSSNSPSNLPSNLPSDKQNKFININNVSIAELNNNKSVPFVIIDTKNYETDNIYFRMNNIKVNVLDLSQVERNFLEIIRFNSASKLSSTTNIGSYKSVSFTEIINTKNRKFALRMIDNNNLNINNIINSHSSYIHNNTNKSIDILVLMIKNKTSGYYKYAYNVFESGTTNILYQNSGLLPVYFNKIDSIVINVSSLINDMVYNELNAGDAQITLLTDPSKFPLNS